ncbi:MAG: hypothetical protein WC891_08720 [Actinomycetota bacterium]
MIKVSKHIESEGIYELDGLDRRFKRFEAAFGWMLPNPDIEEKAVHALVLGGEQEDGRHNLIEEHTGLLHDVIEAAISVKDRFWLRRIWCDPTNIGVIRTIREIDGLTLYKHAGYDVFNRKLYVEKNPEQKWPYSRGHEKTAVILRGVPDFIHTRPEAGINLYLSLAAQKNLLLHPQCKQIEWCMGRHANPKDIVDHPVVAAMGYVLWALEADKALESATRGPKKDREPDGYRDLI